MRALQCVVISAVLIGGCTNRATPVDLSSLATPIAPSPPATPAPPSAPPPVPRGQIVLRSAQPGSGSGLWVVDCSLRHFLEICAKEALLKLDVRFDDDIAEAMVTASFYNGTQLCAMGASYPPVRYTAGHTTSFEIKGLYLSDEAHPLICPLPIETTRLVLQLWKFTQSDQPLLTAEDVPISYTFYE